MNTNEQMRAALEKIREKCVIYNNDLAEEIDAICGNALALPRRNCDVGTAKEQEVRFKIFCESHYNLNNPDSECAGCPLDERVGTECEFTWAQMPYDESEARK
jgi:hypothetical protein